MASIVAKDNPILRKISEPVKPADFGTKKINKIIADMKTALERENDGVAIAAPQIGVSLQIFVVSGKVFDILNKKDDDQVKSEPMVFINPKIIRSSKGKKKVEEGCLSIRDVYGKTIRSEKVRIRASDEEGATFERGGSGLLAQIFQHEIDHLNGILFTDTATDMETYDHKKGEKSKLK